MSRPKSSSQDIASNTTALKEASSAGLPARPKVLNGKAMPQFELPPDFDITIHRKLRQTGRLKPISRAELAALIETLKQKKSDLG